MRSVPIALIFWAQTARTCKLSTAQKRIKSRKYKDLGVLGVMVTNASNIEGKTM